MDLLVLNIIVGIIVILVGIVVSKRNPDQKAFKIITIVGILDVIVSSLRLLL